MNALKTILRAAGLRPKKLLNYFSQLPGFYGERRRFLQMEGAESLQMGQAWPILDEKAEASGNLGGYFLQDLTVASWIHQEAPVRHVDVGSRLDGFVGHLAVFREVDVLDIRAASTEVRNVNFIQLDLMRDLPPSFAECTDSLSCLHTLEHFGLGRYGDSLNPLGHLVGLEQLKRMVKSGGTLYLSVPLGRERIEFNAHRIFSPETLLGWFPDGWKIMRSATISDEERLCTSNGSNEKELLLAAGGCEQGIGIIAVRKA